MKVIKPSYEIIKNNDQPMRHIEAIGRTCYKSGDRITDESAPRFIKMLVNNGHLAMVEHFIFIAKIPFAEYKVLQGINPKFINFSYLENGPIISYSARSILDLLALSIEEVGLSAYKILDEIIEATAMQYSCPELFNLEEGHIYSFKPDIDFISNENALNYFSDKEKYAHCWFSVRFICDRGVSHELVRHRVMSFAQESTRYCDYTDSKFDGELTFIEPHFYERRPDERFRWANAIAVSEDTYNMLIAMDSTPQEARTVLPNSLKTEVCVTGRLTDWYHFFSLRADAPAHPSMRQLATPLLRECKSKYHNIFNDLKEVD